MDSALRCIGTIALGVCASAVGAHADPPPLVTIERLYGTDGLFELNDVDHSGSVIVGNGLFGYGRPFRWTEGVPALIPPDPLPAWRAQYASANGVSADGRTIVGTTTFEPLPIVWRDSGAEYLHHPSGSSAGGSAEDVTSDGRIVVGGVVVDTATGVRWVAALWIDGVLEVLPDPPGEITGASISKVSATGDVMIGAATGPDLFGARAAVWSNGEARLLEPLSDAGTTRAHDISADGHVIVGESTDERGVVQAVRWVDGVLEPLGNLPGGLGGVASVVDASGELIFGTTEFELPEWCRLTSRCSEHVEAFVWSRRSGMRPFEQWMRYGCGYDFLAWHANATLLSGNGRRLAFHGRTIPRLDWHRAQAYIDHCSLDYEVPEWKPGPGDYYVLDTHNSLLFRLSRATGDFERLNWVDGIYLPVDLALGLQGEVYVASASWSRISRIDPRSGAATTLAQGGLLDGPSRIVVGVDGSIYAINLRPAWSTIWLSRIVRIDPETGAQSLVSERGWIQPRALLARRGRDELLTVYYDGDQPFVIGVDVHSGEQRVVTEIVGGAGLGIVDIEYDERRGVLMLTTGLSMFDVDLSSGVMTERDHDRGGDRYISLGSGGDVLSASTYSLFRYDVERGENVVIPAPYGHFETLRAIREWLPRCSDGLDNDRDGLVDADEIVCRSPDNDSEQFRTDGRIDVLPHDPDNVIRVERGVPVPLALFGSPGFDVEDVDVASLEFGPNGAAPIAERGLVSHRSRGLDLDRDGFTDLVLAFHADELGLAFGDEEACLVGTVDSEPFRACDDVSISAEPWCGRGVGLALIAPAVVGALGRRRHRGPSESWRSILR